MLFYHPSDELADVDGTIKSQHPAPLDVAHARGAVALGGHREHQLPDVDLEAAQRALGLDHDLTLFWGHRRVPLGRFVGLFAVLSRRLKSGRANVSRVRSEPLERRPLPPWSWRGRRTPGTSGC